MPIEIIERPAFLVVGLSILTKPMSPQIPALWLRFVARSPEIQGQTELAVSYGIMRQESQDTLLYIAGAAVSPRSVAPVGMEIREVAAGSYARFSYPFGRLGEGFGEIFNRLLPASEYSQAPGFLLERYGKSFDPNNANSIVEILIPVRPR